MKILSFFFAFLTALLFWGAPFFVEAQTTFCGVGYKSDGTTHSTLCPGSDQDRDNHSGDDCDDTDSHIFYPSESADAIQLYTGKGLSAGHYHKCQSDGTYGTNIDSASTPLCEATGSGHCYYIDFVSGSNANGAGSGFNCSYAHPCKDLKNFGYYASGGGADTAPGTYVGANPSDRFYFFNGTYTTETYLGTFSDIQYAMFACRDSNNGGTSSNPIVFKAYPGQTSVVFSPTHNIAFFFGGCAHMAVADGITFDGSAIVGLAGITGPDTIELRNIVLKNYHPTNGSDGGNAAAINFQQGSSRINTHHIVDFDSFDNRATSCGMACSGSGSGDCSCNGNNTGMVLFRGTGNKLTDSLIGYTTAQNVGACLKYKHGSCDAISGVCTDNFIVQRNIFFNCNVDAIASGQPNNTIENNEYVGTGVFFVDADLGGPHYSGGHTIDHNTIIGGRLLEWDADRGWNNDGMAASDICSGQAITSINVHDNVVTGSSGSAITILSYNHYGPDPLYTDIVGGVKGNIHDNCYYNAGAGGFSWDMMSSNDGSTGCTGAGSSGTTYSSVSSVLSGIGIETGTVVGNPSLDSNQITTATCTSAGWSVATTTTTTTTTTTSTTTTTLVSQQKFKKIRKQRGE